MECEDIHYQQYSDGSHSEGQQPDTGDSPEVPLTPQEPHLQSSRIPSVSGVQRVRIGDLGTVEIPKHPKPYVSNQEEREEEDTSTIDENYDIVSLASSIEDQLT